jgi:hypothetical protein
MVFVLPLMRPSCVSTGDDPGGRGPLHFYGGGAAPQPERQPPLRPLRRQGLCHQRRREETKIKRGKQMARDLWIERDSLSKTGP